MFYSTFIGIQMTTAASVMQTLSSFGDRLFVSHQALAEFWRNRMSVLEDRARAKTEIEKRLHEILKVSRPRCRRGRAK